jgi:hypothetical protein
LATKRGYARHHLGGGNVLKAVTRVKRSCAGRSLGRAPGKTPGPAVYKADRRKVVVIGLKLEELEERMQDAQSA